MDTVTQKQFCGGCVAGNFSNPWLQSFQRRD
jgi:hypothetical protein